MKQIQSSEGEELIEEYLDEKGIKFEREVKLKLDNDYADYRIADFYLPRYKVYLEFFGRWDLPENKEKYRKKREIYAKNKMPCVYLYPDNLGILEFILNRRLRKVLKEHPELWFQRLKFHLDELTEKYLLALFGLGFIIYLIKPMIGKIMVSIIFILVLIVAVKNTFLKK